jgi:hypothetical protein
MLHKNETAQDRYIQELIQLVNEMDFKFVMSELKIITKGTIENCIHSKDEFEKEVLMDRTNAYSQASSFIALACTLITELDENNALPKKGIIE